MDLLEITIILSALLCSLVAGFLLAFAVVAMPGIQRLNDHDFLQAFKVMDRVIQNNQPVFMLVWVGSVLALIAATVMGVWRLDETGRALIVASAALYVLGVQLPTAVVNVPLNNQLQRQDLDTLTGPALEEARKQFEPRWIRWNLIRTVLSILATVLLLVLVYRL